MKILLIRMSALGDILMCTPIIRCLKEEYNADIYFLTKPSGATILADNPNIKELLIYDGNLRKCIGQLNSINFDYVADLHGVLRSRLILVSLILINLLHLRILKFGFTPKYSFKRRKAVRLNRLDLLPKLHVIDRHFLAFSKKTFPLLLNDKAGMDYYGDSKTLFPYPKLPTKYIAIAIGSRHFTKQIPNDILSKICHNINDIPIFLLGDKNDIHKANTLLNSLSKNNSLKSDFFISLCGILSFEQTASIVRNASVVISGDSILMHLAAALNKPLVSIWGSTVPELGMYPCYKNTDAAPNFIFEVKDLDCRPCHLHGRKACPLNHFNCMNQQNIDNILLRIKTIIES